MKAFRGEVQSFDGNVVVVILNARKPGEAFERYGCLDAVVTSETAAEHAQRSADEKVVLEAAEHAAELDERRGIEGWAQKVRAAISRLRGGK